jgi:hypothetical protein
VILEKLTLFDWKEKEMMNNITFGRPCEEKNEGKK